MNRNLGAFGIKPLCHMPDASTTSASPIRRSRSPKATLRNVARRVFAGAGEQRAMMQRIVPEATYKRRRERLSPAESERTERVARVVATAEDVWQNREQARRFLTTPHPEMGGKTPLDAALTELGARQAEEVMARIVYGLPA